MPKIITLGGRELTLHAIPVEGLKAMGNNLTQIGTMSTLGMEAVVDALYYGVKRGARDDATITREFFAWEVDNTNIAGLIADIAEVNGMVPKEGSAQGEA